MQDEAHAHDALRKAVLHFAEVIAGILELAVDDRRHGEDARALIRRCDARRGVDLRGTGHGLRAAVIDGRGLARAEKAHSCRFRKDARQFP